MKHRAFGKYEVLARLATGGAANIFLARQPGAAGFHKLVVLKALLPDRASDQDFVAMFLDEARLAARLVHPSCVQIYDLGRVRGVYYISMEFIFGETLWNLLTTVRRTKTALPTSHVAAIVADVCDGLHHAHELKDPSGRPFHLVHRDVSPQNIMVSFEGQTKVLDFGIAKAETGRDPTHAGIVKGKYAYMSPEQITGGEVDRRSDIFSLGIVLFECLASRRLFRAETPAEIAKLIVERRVPRLSELVPDMPPALDEICARALQPRLGKRFQTALEMGDALRGHLDDLRFHHSSSGLAALAAERFGAMIPERRHALELALERNQTGALLEAFGAGPVREVDLFPKEVTATSAPDFTESSTVLPDSAIEGATPADDPTPQRGLATPGFRVELESASGAPQPIALGALGALAPDEEGSDRTRRISPVDMELEGDVEPDAVIAPSAPLASSAPSAPLASSAPSAPLASSAPSVPLADEHPKAWTPRRVAGPGPGSEARVAGEAPSVVVSPLEDRGYGLSALLAALGFGLAFGIVIGMAFAALLFVR